MDSLLLVVLLGLVSLAAAHYAGYPFVHANDGRYGAQYRVANYKDESGKVDTGANSDNSEDHGTRRRPRPHAAALAGRVADGKRFGFMPRANSERLEFGFRKHKGFPVHLGNGNFYFLGDFAEVSCREKAGNGLYFTGDRKTYTVCENGRAHKFSCPDGTRNKESTFFHHNEKYSMSDLCSEHD